MRVGDHELSARRGVWRRHLEHENLRDVVLEQSVQRTLVGRVPLPSDGIELYLIDSVGHDNELIATVKDRTAIHLAVLPHELARLALVHALRTGVSGVQRMGVNARWQRRTRI